MRTVETPSNSSNSTGSFAWMTAGKATAAGSGVR